MMEVLDRGFLAPHAVSEWAGRTPGGVALEHVDGTRVTYGELHEDALAWAGAFSRLGVGAGDHVATFLPNVFAYHRALLGLAWLRAVEVPLNAAYTGRMLEYTLGTADVSTLVTSVRFWEHVVEAAPQVPTLERVVVVDGAPPSEDLPCPVVALDELLAGVEPEERFEGPECWDVAALLYTSGTTGPSKAVITPWGFIYQFWSWVPEETVGRGEGLFCPMPLFHGAGRSGFNYAMTRGARFIIDEKFSATKVWDQVRATDAVALGLVGAMTSLLHAAPRSDADADNPVRHVILGPMIPEIEDFEQRFDVRVATCYGQTEIGSPIVTGFDHGPWANSGRVRTDYPHPEVRVVDEHDQPLGPGEVGELIVRTDEPWAMNLGYYGNPEEAITAWRNGWFHTGDAFRYDQDGRFYFVDRLTDTIRRRGENISSFEVENFVLEHPEIRECAALATPGEHGDDDILVAVVPEHPDTFDPAELTHFLQARMPHFMTPRYIDTLDHLPRTEATNRVRKTELRHQHPTPTAWDRTRHPD